ncbi:helix-turn-helix domain-containing protein [Desulfobacter hydrogenophilus]|nr:helix-turn-helix domain-containing protein [Desulfobacter hydrogenophilus]
MVLNSWDKIFEELPDAAYNTETSSSENTSQGQLAGSAIHSSEHRFDNDPGNRRLRIISEFVDLSTSSEKLFEDISLKKIKKLASDKVEKEVILFVLEKVGWNRSRAAKILKVSYKTLLYKMNEFDVNPPMS